MSLFLIIGWILGFSLIGSTTLKIIGIKELKGIQFLTLSFWIGYIIYGFLFFILGTAPTLFPEQVPDWIGINFWCALSLFALGIPALLKKHALEWWMIFEKGHLFFLLFALIAFLNLPMAFAPIAEGDSLAYHFGIPKLFFNEGRIVFEPIAVDFATPLLSQLISTAAYTLGGEKLMLLNAWVTYLMSGFSVYALARRRLRSGGSWIFASIFMSIPAVLYGAVAGTVEIRMMGIISIAALVALLAIRSEKMRWYIVLGILCGGLMAMKYFGLFVCLTFGLVTLLLVRNIKFWENIKLNTVFTLVTILIGFQWYAWNAYHTGTPTFPILYEQLGKQGWSEKQQEYFENVYLTEENMIERTPSTLASYPFLVTIEGDKFDSARTGLGPIFLMIIIPSLILFILRFPWLRRGEPIGTLEIFTALFLIYYVIWFFFGVSGRPRHLLPFLPLLALPTWIYIQQIYVYSGKFVRTGFCAIIFGILCVQGAFTLMLNKAPISLMSKNISVEEYKNRYVPNYQAAKMVNSILTQDDKLMHALPRPMPYQFEVPYYYAITMYQDKIPLSYGSSIDILNAIYKENITHWLTQGNPMDASIDNPGNAHRHIRTLIAYGCLEEVAQSEGKIYNSRTYAALGSKKTSYHLFKLIPYCTGNEKYKEL